MSIPSTITWVPSTQRESATGRRWLVGAVLVLLVGVAVAARLVTGQSSNVPGHPDNPGDDGAMAVTRILGEHGVRVHLSERTATTLEAGGDVIAIVDPGLLSDVQLEKIAALGTDLVLIDAAAGRAGVSERLDRTGYGASESIPADCDFEHARAAGTVSAGGSTFTGPDGADVCFPVGDEGGLVVHWRDEGRSITTLPLSMLVNGSLAEEGNAALALRVLGTSQNLTWMVAVGGDSSGTATLSPERPLSLLWTGAAVLAIAVAWWQMPRFGRLVVEPLPVVVPASETVTGRGALYRRHRDVAHAAGALRLGALRRIADRIGLAPYATRAEVIERLTTITGRPAAAVAEVFYGAPPSSTAGLSALAHALDTIESEVHRR